MAAGQGEVREGAGGGRVGLDIRRVHKERGHGPVPEGGRDAGPEAVEPDRVHLAVRRPEGAESSAGERVDDVDVAGCPRPNPRGVRAPPEDRVLVDRGVREGNVLDLVEHPARHGVPDHEHVRVRGRDHRTVRGPGDGARLRGMGLRGEEDPPRTVPDPEVPIRGYRRDLQAARTERDVRYDVGRGCVRVRALPRGDRRRPSRLVVEVEEEDVRVVRLSQVRVEPEIPPVRVAGGVQVREVEVLLVPARGSRRVVPGVCPRPLQLPEVVRTVDGDRVGDLERARSGD